METLRVLLVEDNEIDVEALRRCVERQDLPYELTVCASRTEGQEALRGGSFDVALIDYYLGDGLGTELIHHAGETPVVMVTGMGDEEIAASAMRNGAYDYLVKDSEGRYLKVLPEVLDNVSARKRAEGVASADLAAQLAEATDLSRELAAFILQQRIDGLVRDGKIAGKVDRMIELLDRAREQVDSANSA